MGFDQHDRDIWKVIAAIKAHVVDIEKRTAGLETYVANQTVRSADFGKRFAALEASVAALTAAVTALQQAKPQHQLIPQTTKDTAAYRGYS